MADNTLHSSARANWLERRFALRSRGGTDVARVAMALGGGGHTLAAGYSSILDREGTIAALRRELRAD